LNELLGQAVSQEDYEKAARETKYQKGILILLLFSFITKNLYPLKFIID
jgi:hypothetical protein